MEFSQHWVFQYLAQLAFEPNLVYLTVFGMMLLSAFGLPIPEEVTIISVGIIAFMGANPELFPPPYPGAPVVDGYEAAAIVFFAVFLSDHLVYFLGRFYGRKLFTYPKLQKVFSKKVMDRIDYFTKKYGDFAAFIFRFLPGIRFPGHIALGMGRFPLWKFTLIDFFAAAVSVPTQILMIFWFGEPILKTLSDFKTVLFIGLGIIIVFLFIRHRWFKTKNA